MSKPRKKKKNKFPVIHLIITVAGLLLVAAAYIFLNSEQMADEPGTPVMVVDQAVIDFGDVKFGVEKTFSIRVTNNGDGTLRFKEEPYIQVLEGC